MSEQGRERERKTSPDFNDISNIHADAFCCFVLSFLSASSASPARRTHPSLREGRGMREKEGKKTSGNKENKLQSVQLSQYKKPFVLAILPSSGM